MSDSIPINDLRVQKYTPFNLYPAKGHSFLPHHELYFQIQVYETKDKMLDGYSELRPEWNREELKFDACVVPIERRKISTDGSEELNPEIGCVFFHRQRVGSEITAHESVHIATSFLRVTRQSENIYLATPYEELSREGYRKKMLNEEYLAYLIGNANRQLVSAFYDLGIYE